MDNPEITAFFDAATFTVSYIVADPATGQAALIDPVLDYDAHSGRTSTVSIDRIAAHISQAGYEVAWILETHVHADHLSGAQSVKERLGGETAIGTNVSTVQKVFKNVFNIDDLAVDGRQFDRLFSDGDTFKIGEVEASVVATPGHTPACVTYLIGNCAFVGDTLFMPDFGTARTDFPGGDAHQLYASIQRILSLPDDTSLFMCHDYKAPGRDEYAWQSSVREQRTANIHINERVSEDEFVTLRQGRDRQLGMPKLLLPAIQVNVRAGHLPAAESNGIRYLKIPLDAV